MREREKKNPHPATTCTLPAPHFITFSTNNETNFNIPFSLHGFKTRLTPGSHEEKDPHYSHATGMPEVPRENTQTRPKNVENADLPPATQRQVLEGRLEGRPSLSYFLYCLPSLAQ